MKGQSCWDTDLFLLPTRRAGAWHQEVKSWSKSPRKSATLQSGGEEQPGGPCQCPPLSLPPPGRASTWAPDLFCLQPGTANSLISLLPAYPQERSCCRAAGIQSPCHEGLSPQISGQGNFLPCSGKWGGRAGAAPLLLGEGEPSSQVAPREGSWAHTSLPAAQGATGEKEEPSGFLIKLRGWGECTGKLWQSRRKYYKQTKIPQTKNTQS